MSFQNKYLKYKNKYLDLKKQIGGSTNNKTSTADNIPVAPDARPPITNTSNCLALLQNGVYSQTELLSMMNRPMSDINCLECDERGCYGRCSAKEACDCKDRCKAISCGAHGLFRAMSILNGAHPYYYSVKYYCPICVRVGCKCNIPSNVTYFNDNNYDGTNNDGGGGSSDNGYSGRDSSYSRRNGRIKREDEW